MLNEEQMTEVEQQALEMVHNYLGSSEAVKVNELFCTDDSILEAILYTIYADALKNGDLVPTTYLHQATEAQEKSLGDHSDCEDCDGDGVHASPVVMAPAIVLRHMMYTAMCLGMHYQKDISNLDNIWGRD